MSTKLFSRRLKTGVLLCAALGCTVAAAASAREQVRQLQMFQSSVLPATAEIAGLQRRIAVLSDQEEASEAQRMVSGGISEEHLRAFMVPLSLSRERIVGFAEAVADALKKEGVLKDAAAVTIGDADDTRVASGATLLFTPVSLTLHVRDDAAVAPALAAFDTAGALTVIDALSPQDIALLLSLSEQENPASIVSLEQFFDTDLLTYAQQSRAIEDQLLKSFTSPAFATALQAALQAERVQSLRRLLGGPLGERLSHDQLWPPPLLLLQGLSQKRQADGSVILTVTFDTATRGDTPLDPAEGHL